MFIYLVFILSFQDLTTTLQDIDSYREVSFQDFSSRPFNIENKNNKNSILFVTTLEMYHFLYGLLENRYDT